MNRDFLERMKSIPGLDLDAFLASLGDAPFRALRYNPLKIGQSGESAAQDRPNPGWSLRRVPWCAEGVYYSASDQPGKHPLHAAGAYYIQEPSAMLPAELLRETLAEGTELRVLDLCAAPGGKSAQLAGMMGGRGLLVANEIHPARARILSENIERMGVRNAVVTNEPPERLAEWLPEFFDAVLVDAPCSGEGMFRKDPGAVLEWTPETPRLCAERQAGILASASELLRPGGTLIYSTCTFEPEENEGQIASFLGEHPEFSLCPASEVKTRIPNAGRADGLSPCEGAVRLWPMDAEGEGHFAARLRKEGDGSAADALGGYETPLSGRSRELAGVFADYRAFLGETASEDCFLRREAEGLLPQKGGFMLFGENLYRVPAEVPALKGRKILRCGLHLGTFRKNRFEPSHALALALSPGEVRAAVCLDEADAERYLAGQTLEFIGGKGWTLVCHQGYSLGWGKSAGGALKNHYPKGLRRL